MPHDGETVAPTDSWRPDVVILTLGVNDWAVGVPPEERFRQAYCDLVRAVRQAYGDLPIVCALSSTLTDHWPVGQNWRSSMRAWLGQIVEILREEGCDVSLLEFKERRPEEGHGADYHPSAATQRKMAAQLVDTLRALIKW